MGAAGGALSTGGGCRVGGCSGRAARRGRGRRGRGRRRPHRRGRRRKCLRRVGCRGCRLRAPGLGLRPELGLLRGRRLCAALLQVACGEGVDVGRDGLVASQHGERRGHRALQRAVSQVALLNVAEQVAHALGDVEPDVLHHGLRLGVGSVAPASRGTARTAPRCRSAGRGAGWPGRG
eukprot:scaffold298_cov63-Phaeocystis_antarctica.AAC.3